jgi:hypothetical protein
MSDPMTPGPYRPIETESSGLPTLARTLVPLVLLACLVLSFFPDVLRRVLPGWHGDPTSIRVGAFVALFVFAAANAVASQRRRNAALRAAFAEFAARTGGQAEDRPLRATASGWEGGPQVSYRVSGFKAVLGQERGKSSAYSYRLVADVALRRDFQLQIVPGGAAMRFLFSKSFVVPVLTVAIRTSASSRAGVPGRSGTSGATPNVPSAGREALLERIRYIGSDPITIGDETFDRNFLVKASDTSDGKAFVSDPSVRAALAALRERAPQFMLGLESETLGGPGRLLVTISVPNPSGEAFVAMDAVLRAAVLRLDRMDLLPAGTRGAA